MKIEIKKNHTGIAYALITVIIWSGNYVIAKGIARQIPPISLAFFRWGTATIFMLPIAWKKLKTERNILLQHKWYLLWAALTGVTLFNTFIYVAGHYTSAINLALIGTTSAPVFITFFSAFFLKEKIKVFHLTGMLLCIAGIIVLLSQGSWQRLLQFHFGKGDLWVLTSAVIFAVYSTLVKKKPAQISPSVFLITIFITGSLILLPFSLIELHNYPPIEWTSGMIATILYLGIGNSVIGFLCWNASINILGAGRTGLFGNLIPVFSTIEAVLILGEQFTIIHLISGLIVISGLVIANIKSLSTIHDH